MIVMVRHKVKDYGFWRKVYDAHENSRKDIGAENFRVYRDSKNNNDVVVMADVTDEAKLKSLAADRELKQLLEKSGVIGMPVVTLLENM